MDTPLTRVLPLALLILLSSCVSHELDTAIKQGGKKLTESQLRELVNGATARMEGYGQEATVEFSGDGTMAGTNTSGEKDKGQWHVQGEEFCLRFKKWGGGDAKCYQAVGEGGTYQLYNRKGMMTYTLSLIKPGEMKAKVIAAPAAQEAAPRTAEAEPSTSLAQEIFAERQPPPVTRQSVEDVGFIIRQTAQNCPGCNLARAQLAGQTLIGANLQGANLAEADLSRANLRRANLRGANLYRANLKGADLAGADLTGANLSEVIK